MNMKEQLFSIILRLVLIVVLAVGVIAYAERQINSRVKEMREKRTLLAIWDERAEALTRLQQDYRTIEPKSALLESALPTADDLFTYFNKLDGIAKRNGLTQQLNIGQQITPAEGNEPAGMMFRVTIDGTLPNFLNYLRETEQLPHFVKFGEFTMVGLEGLYNPSRVNYSGKIYTAP